MNHRILCTGVTSIHGWPIFDAFSHDFKEAELLGIRSPKMKIPEAANIHSCCITDINSLLKFRNHFKPTHVIHCAGVCDLDVCEARPEWAYSLNTDGSRIVADVFGDTCKVIYMSADLVFSGNDTLDGGYNETCRPDPVSVVGKTMAGAEFLISQCKDSCIIRLGLPIGQSVTSTKGAVDFIASRLGKKLPVSLFHDEWRSCIACDEIANVLQKIIMADLKGIWHLGGPRKYSLYEIGKRVLEKNGFDAQYLKGIMRKDEKNGPPRMGDVSLDSSRIQRELDIKLNDPFNS